jgi:hypothetical protein
MHDDHAYRMRMLRSGGIGVWRLWERLSRLTSFEIELEPTRYP